VPTRQYAIRFDSPESTNTPLGLQFGATNEGRIFARRTDEDSVYAVPAARVQALPTTQWQLRLRRPWDFTVEDINRVTVRDSGQTRELLRKGDKSWALTAGSQGVINDLAVEETMRGVAVGGVDRWTALGAEHQAKFGITETSPRLTVELKNGQRLEASFGNPTPSNGLYVALTLHGMTWIGEYPWILCRDIAVHLAPPQEKSGK
jgi:hypothetical protein